MVNNDMGSNVEVFGCRYGVELGREGLEIAVFVERMFRCFKGALSFGLKMNFGWAKRVLLDNELVPVVGF
jgi:hypothetical protein